MRIAILLSGFIRIWKDTKQSFMEQILKDKDVEIDIFIHTYKQNYYEFTAGKKDELISEEEFKSLFEGLNIKSIVVEDRDELLPKLLDDSSKYKHISNFGLMQQESSDTNSISIPIGTRTYDHLRKLHLCNQLRKTYERENNLKYDLIVKTRFDVVYFNTPKWNHMLDNQLHFGYGATWGWPEDTFCVATPHIMDLYSDRFTNFDEIFLTEKETIGICSHGTLKYIIDKHNLQIGLPGVNILCFRNDSSVQYGGNYRFKCDLKWLYNQLSSISDNVYEIENEKNRIMKQL